MAENLKKSCSKAETIEIESVIYDWSASTCGYPAFFDIEQLVHEIKQYFSIQTLDEESSGQLTELVDKGNLLEKNEFPITCFIHSDSFQPAFFRLYT